MGKKEEVINRLETIEKLATDVVNAVHALREQIENDDDEQTENTVPPGGGGGGGTPPGGGTGGG